MAVRVNDEIECPECGGTGEQRLGPLRLMCVFCDGRKVVGGAPEQAEDGPRHRRGEASGTERRGRPPAVWEHPAVRGSGLCPHCLGAGVVVAGGSYAEAPCPVCSGRGR